MRFFRVFKNSYITCVYLTQIKTFRFWFTWNHFEPRIIDLTLCCVILNHNKKSRKIILSFLKQLILAEEDIDSVDESIPANNNPTQLSNKYFWLKLQYPSKIAFEVECSRPMQLFKSSFGNS